MGDGINTAWIGSELWGDDVRRLSDFIRLVRKQGVRAALSRVAIYPADRATIWRKKRKLLEADETVMLDLKSNSVEANRRKWNTYDWAHSRGEEWTLDAGRYSRLDPQQWKSSLVDGMMLNYIKEHSSILEIGPGGGRWTETLQRIANRLVISDISQTCLDICEERFRLCSNIEYNLIEKGLDFLASDSVDYVWAYDVFVHINPTDIEAYIIDIGRVMRLDGYAIIHHAGKYSREEDRGSTYRTYMTGELFVELVTKHGMTVIEQNDALPHMPGDLITVFTK